MKKKNLFLGIPVLMLVFTMTVLGACKSSPAVEAVMPDDQSAVVYFFGFKKDGASVWDGERRLEIMPKHRHSMGL